MLSSSLSEPGRSRGYLCCVVFVSTVILSIVATAADESLAEESAATVKVKLELERRTAERDAAAKERQTRVKAVSTIQQEIESLQARLKDATMRLQQQRQAEQRAVKTEAAAETLVKQLAQSLKQHREVDSLRTAANNARQTLETQQAELTRQSDQLQALREDAIRAGIQAGNARRLAEQMAEQAAGRQAVLDMVAQQARQAESVLDASRVQAIQASRMLAARQRTLSLGTLRMNRARAAMSRLQTTSAAIESAIVALQPARELFADSTAEEIGQLNRLLESMRPLLVTAEQMVVKETAAVDGLREQAQQSGTALETAETERRKHAEQSSTLGRQHFTLQREMAQLQAGSQHQQQRAQQQSARQEQLTTEIVQVETAAKEQATRIEMLTAASMAAQRRLDEAGRLLGVAATPAE